MSADPCEAACQAQLPWATMVLALLPSCSSYQLMGKSLTIRSSIADPVDLKGCVIVVEMEAEPESTKASWFDIWAAGIEVYTLCAQHGLSGSLGYLGEHYSQPPS